MDPRDEGIVVGLLIGEGSSAATGASRRSPCACTSATSRCCAGSSGRFPRSRLYGPYHHGGRRYFQWMARGEALVLESCRCSNAISRPTSTRTPHARLTAMTERYADVIARLRAAARVTLARRA